MKKIILIISTLVIVSFGAYYWLFSEKQRLLSCKCENPSNLGCFSPNFEAVTEKIVCNTNTDCQGSKLVEACRPGYPALANCPANIYCGDDGYCKQCVCCSDK